MKLEVAMQAIGEDDPAAMGLKEALQRARVQAQLRQVQDWISHTEAFLNRSRRVGDHDVRSTKIERGHHRIGVKNPGWRTSLEGLKSEASVQTCPFVEATENVGEFVSRVDAFGLNNTRWGVDGESHPSNRRVHEELMSIFEVPEMRSTGCGESE